MRELQSSPYRKAHKVLARFLRAKDVKKRMILMMGPPAAGKGFFLGEPEFDKKTKEPLGPPKNKYGWKLPEMMVDADGKPLLTDEDIPPSPAQDESDNHLKWLQTQEAKKHYQALAAAHKKGKDAFKEALDDHWYDTKDGEKIKLGSVVDFDSFPKDAESFLDKTKKDFYVSMRGWHDDAKEENPTTGKPKERFKDEARHLFDDAVQKKITEVKDMLIVDSAGEDIDAQDYKGQIEEAKAHGFEVTVIFLHPEEADTGLSNVARGKIQGKRMVDQTDIRNWYEQNADALRAIQAAAPHNFLHYRKGPPDSNPKKAAEMRAKARDTMNKLKGLSGKEKEAAEKEAKDIVYGIPYKMQKDTSFGLASSLSKEPKKKNIADAVAEMNQEAEARVKSVGKPKADKEDTKADESKAKAPESKSNGSGAKKPEKKKRTKTNWLTEMGDRKVRNPNPDGTKDQVLLRGLPWKYQQPYYEQWARRTAARVLARYQRKQAMGWIKDWMQELADQASELEYDYKVKVEPTEGPEIYVTLIGGSEDSTAARKARQKLEKLMIESIKKNNFFNMKGIKPQIRSYNQGKDLVLQCTILHPD